MLDKIEALRKEPVHVRNRYAFWGAFCITLLIALIWAVSLPSRFAVTEEVEAEPIVVEETSRLGTLFASAGLRLKEVIDTFRTTKIQEESSATPQREELDFEALIASSTQKKLQAEVATSTVSSTTATSSNPTSTTTQTSE